MKNIIGREAIEMLATQISIGAARKHCLDRMEAIRNESPAEGLEFTDMDLVAFRAYRIVHGKMIANHSPAYLPRWMVVLRMIEEAERVGLL